MMNANDRMKLQRYYCNLIEVSYSSISAHLISNFIIDLETHAEIDALPNEKKKIERLLVILPSRGDQAMTELINALRPNYRWIADSLCEDPAPAAPNVLNNLNSNGVAQNCNVIGTNPSPTSNEKFPNASTALNYGNSDKLKDMSISKYLIPVGKAFHRSPRVSQNWCLLAHTMAIDPCTVANIKRQMNHDGGIAYAVNTVLEAWISKLGPSKATFARLIEITEGEGINEVTEDLEELWKSLQ